VKTLTKVMITYLPCLLRYYFGVMVAANIVVGEFITGCYCYHSDVGAVVVIVGAMIRVCLF